MYPLFVFKKIRRQKDVLILIFNCCIMYNYILNTFFSIKNNTQYQSEPIFWKINSILNDSIMSIYVLGIILTYISYVSFGSCNTITLAVIFYFMLQTNKVQFVFGNIIKISSYNVTLFNGLLLIHPIYLYIGYSCILYLYSCLRKFKFNTFNYISIKKMKNFFFISSNIALLLGCWWAQQEISWGGWWNWDPIELIALMVFILSLTIMHTNYNVRRFLVVFNSTVVTFTAIIYFISRYDLLNSIHSFAVSSRSQNYLEIKMVLLCIIFFRYLAVLFEKFFYYYYNLYVSYILCFVFIYFLFNLIGFVVQISLSSILSLTFLEEKNKNVYLILMFFILIILPLKFKFKINCTWFTVCFWLNLTALYLFTILINFFKKIYYLIIFSKYKKISYRNVNIHMILLVMFIILLFYSNIEVFFLKQQKFFVYQTYLIPLQSQLTELKSNVKFNYWFSHRTANEPFLISNSNFTKLLAQQISSNTNANLNTVIITKNIDFVQNYMYICIIIWLPVYLFVYYDIFKSGIV